MPQFNCLKETTAKRVLVIEDEGEMGLLLNILPRRKGHGT